jgi:hypothetical protein
MRVLKVVWLGDCRRPVYFRNFRTRAKFARRGTRVRFRKHGMWVRLRKRRENDRAIPLVVADVQWYIWDFRLVTESCIWDDFLFVVVGAAKVSVESFDDSIRARVSAIAMSSHKTPSTYM